MLKIVIFYIKSLNTTEYFYTLFVFIPSIYLYTRDIVKLDKKFYLLGGVGGWKDYFTVRQSEEWDKLVEEKLKNTEVKFKYTI